MYNKDISILGYKFNLEVLILIGVVYLILVGHTFCGCCNFGLMEGFDGSGNSLMPDEKLKLEKDKLKIQKMKTNMATQNAAGGATSPDSTESTTTTKEGFTPANINYGESSLYNSNTYGSTNTSSWSAPNMTFVSGQPLNSAVKKFMAREPQPVPLPEGEMLLFANTPFKPECCPNTYSTSSGCACMTSEQYNFIVTRSGNNVPYSQY